MSKILKFLIISIIVCSGIVLILLAFMPRPNEKKNGFTRTIRENVASLEHVIDLKYTGYYFAGNSSHNIYFGNYSSSIHLLSFNSESRDTMSYKFQLEKPDSGHWEYARISVDSPFVYLSEGITPIIYSARIDKPVLKKYLNEICYFNSDINISTSSFVVKGNNSKKQTILVKIQLDSPYLIPKSNILTKQVDGIFCTDGTLIFDNLGKTLVYLYYYRNEFIHLDTNLIVLNKIHTIDTNSIAKIRVSQITNRGSTFSAPALRVNNGGAIYKGNLFISSTLLADNETKIALDKNEIVDVYNIESGAYLYSFYLPKYKGKGARQFIITNNKLYSIQNRYLLTYALP